TGLPAHAVLALFDKVRRAIPATAADLDRWAKTILAPATQRYINLLLLPPTGPGRRFAAELAGPDPFASEPGELLDFSDGGAGHRYTIPVGWSYPEAWGTWTDGPAAELRLRLPPDPGRLELAATCHGEAWAERPLRVRVQANGRRASPTNGRPRAPPPSPPRPLPAERH
ncbi:MAG: hypothetical protein ACE5JG_13625, partial [Planctomycetota bacterium]